MEVERIMSVLRTALGTECPVREIRSEADIISAAIFS
jgi:hypothetical protein